MGISLQPQAGVVTAYRSETTFGSLPTNDSSARIFRTTAGQGLKLNKAPIQSGEVRSDMQRQRDRHGAQSVTGTLGGELSLGTFDDLLQGVMRSTWAAPLTSASWNGSYDAATGIITRATGSFATEGFRVGDVVTLSVGAGANSNIPVALAAVGTTTVTVANATALTTAPSMTGVTMARPKKLVTGTTRRSFSFEHWAAGITNSERFVGVRVSSMAITVPASGPIGVEFGFTGRQQLPAETSRYFTSATSTTALQMVSPDAVIALAGAQSATVTALTLTLNNNHTVPPVAGTTLSPDVIEGAAAVTGSVTLYVRDQSQLNAFLNETPQTLTLVARELGTAGFVSFSVTNFTLGDYTTERIGQSDAQLVTFPLLVGIASGADRDASMLTICTSAA